MVIAASIAALGAAAPPPKAPIGENPEVRFTVQEPALLELLRATTPQTVTVGSSLMSTELTMLDPSDLVLSPGKATFKIRVKSRQIALDQVVQPVVTVDRDPRTQQYYGVVNSLPLQIPGAGKIDLRDFLPRLEIPPVIENPWPVAGGTLAVRLRIRRIAILDHQLEVGADVDLAPAVPARATTR
ncbi:MAG TPA: hypothetical protein VJV75_11560 [Candidatus Polarisedimenticolia bacterium]|nr:hypothetical protein [Candidatus Polarisedimenticolia bacterium]